MTPHACPHCRCQPHDDGYRMTPVNKTAEFYPLVELITSLRGQHMTAEHPCGTMDGAGAASTARPPARHDRGARHA
jgi:hypothetical protein